MLLSIISGLLLIILGVGSIAKVIKYPWKDVYESYNFNGIVIGVFSIGTGIYFIVKAIEEWLK